LDVRQRVFKHHAAASDKHLGVKLVAGLIRHHLRGRLRKGDKGRTGGHRLIEYCVDSTKQEAEGDNSPEKPAVPSHGLDRTSEVQCLLAHHASARLPAAPSSAALALPSPNRTGE